MLDSPVKPGQLSIWRLLWQIIGWAQAFLITWLSLTPRPPTEVFGMALWDKAAHAAAYFSLTFWFAQCHARRLPVALWALALGGALEIAQGFTDYREASFFDMLANALGVALGWIAAERLPNLLERLEGS